MNMRAILPLAKRGRETPRASASILASPRRQARGDPHRPRAFRLARRVAPRRPEASELRETKERPRSALNLAARRDPSIHNRAAWADGLSGVREDSASRDIQRLDDDQVRAVIAGCYALDRNLGLYVESEPRRERGRRRIAAGRRRPAERWQAKVMMPSSRKAGAEAFALPVRSAGSSRKSSGDREPMPAAAPRQRKPMAEHRPRRICRGIRAGGG